MHDRGYATFSVAHTFSIYFLTIMVQKLGGIAVNQRCQLRMILVDFSQHRDEVSPTVTAPDAAFFVASADFASRCTSLHLGCGQADRSGFAANMEHCAPNQ